MFSKTLQFNYFKVKFSSLRKYCNMSTNKKLLMEIFGCSGSEAELFMRKCKALQRKEPDDLMDSYHFCKKIGISNKDLLMYPALLTSHPLRKIQHYKTLEEAGFKNIDGKLLSRADKYIRRKVIQSKAEGYLDPDINVRDRFMSYLDPPIKKPKFLDKPLQTLDEMTIATIHKHILDDWLKVRLNTTEDDLIKLFRIHKMIQTKSFRTINENITLAESIGLNHAKILKCGYLLNNYPEYPKTVLREFPNLAGLDMSRAMKINPKLMMVAPKRILKIYGILKEFDIPDEYIQHVHQIFCMNTETLRFRLNEINKIPEFKALKHNPQMLRLVLHHKSAKTKLTFLQQLKLRCAGFTLLVDLSKREGRFDNHIKEGKDVNSATEVIHFFARLFETSNDEIRNKLNRHPYYTYVPFLNMQETYDFLIRMGYKKQNICRSLWIVLYPKTKIQEATKILHKETDLNFHRLSQWKKLHLILYQIEKEHHFTGNGIWSSESMEDSHSLTEEKTLE